MTGLSSMIVLSLIVGFLIGAIYFVSLWRSVQALTRSDSRWRAFAAGGLLRLLMVLGVLAALFGLGVDPLLVLSGGVGFLFARLAATALARPWGAPASKGS